MSCPVSRFIIQAFVFIQLNIVKLSQSVKEFLIFVFKRILAGVSFINCTEVAPARTSFRRRREAESLHGKFFPCLLNGSMNFRATLVALNSRWLTGAYRRSTARPTPPPGGPSRSPASIRSSSLSVKFRNQLFFILLRRANLQFVFIDEF